MRAKQLPLEKRPHATRRLFSLYLAAGVLFLGAGVVQLLGAQLVLALGCALFGGFFVVIGAYGRRSGVGVQLVHA